MQRPANRLRRSFSQPHIFKHIIEFESIITNKMVSINLPGGGIGRHKGLKIPR